jgi:sulfotransferase family protein
MKNEITMRRRLLTNALYVGKRETSEFVRAKGKKYITIVSGLPRSGTSMMMRMLEAGGMPVLTDNIRKADADNPNGYFEFELVKQLTRDTSWLVDAHGKAVKMASLLLYDLPRDHEYKVIFMRRKLEEVITSQEAMLRRQGKNGGARDAAQLANLFHNHLQKLDVWIRNQENFSVLYVNYNNMLNNPKSSVIEIDWFLGYGLDTDAMGKIFDLSLYRQRR